MKPAIQSKPSTKRFRTSGRKSLPLNAHLSPVKNKVAAAKIAFEGVELEQQVGTRNTLDVLDAEQELLNAKLSVIQAERNFNVATYQLLVTIGGFDAYSLQLPVDGYDPRDNFYRVTTNPFGKYLPGPVERALDSIPEKTTDAINFVGSKVSTDLIDLSDALLPNSVALGKVGKDISNFMGAITPINSAKTDNPTFNDNVADPGTKVADPDFINPEPILIFTEQKPKPEE